MPAKKPEELAVVQQRAVKRGCSTEAVDRFAERYPEHCQRGDNGQPIGVVPRLRVALELAQQGKAKFRPGRAGLFQNDDDFQTGRKIFDVELPADWWNPEPYTIRILTDPAVTCVITVLPPEFRKDMHAKKKHRELRRIVDEETNEAEPESPTEKVALPPPVNLTSSLGDKLRAALGGKAA